MLQIGCSGFPVPATRYLREFMLEEVADTHLGVPGPALVRRWRRESPEGFLFTALAPRELTAEGFRRTSATDTAWDGFLPVVRELSARSVVVVSPPDLAVGKASRAAVRAFFEALAPRELPALVWEPPPTWEIKEAESAVRELGVLVARDPLRHPPFGKVARGYYRLNGPAGHKSRYEDPAIELIAEVVNATQSSETLLVFANVDMYADAKRLRRSVER